VKNSNNKTNDITVPFSMSDGLIAFVDVEKGGKIIYVNKAFEKMVGWKNKEVINKCFVDVLSREDKNGNVVPIKHLLKTKFLIGEKITSDLNQPFYYLRRDKSKFPVKSFILPFRLNKTVIGGIETFREITKESAVDESKTNFTTITSHQLRTPFTTMSWYIEVLLAEDIGKLNQKQTQYLQEIYRASKKMFDLANEIECFSRSEEQKTTIKVEPTDIISLAEGILKERFLMIQEK
jgi:PAS domain S-box-containing protein